MRAQVGRTVARLTDAALSNCSIEWRSADRLVWHPRCQMHMRPGVLVPLAFLFIDTPGRNVSNAVGGSPVVFETSNM